MVRKCTSQTLIVGFLALLAGCSNVLRPLEDGSQHPDRVLFERGMESIQDQRIQEGLTLLESLVDTYPESQYGAQAKSMLDDMWYAEGGFGPRPEKMVGEGQTFFPSLEETHNAAGSHELRNVKFAKN
jgi:hypothetical protein